MLTAKLFSGSRVQSQANPIGNLNLPSIHGKSITQGWHLPSKALRHALNWKHVDITRETTKTGNLRAAHASHYTPLHSAPYSCARHEPLRLKFSMLGFWHRLNHSAVFHPYNLAISETELKRKGLILLRQETLEAYSLNNSSPSVLWSRGWKFHRKLKHFSFIFPVRKEH